MNYEKQLAALQLRRAQDEKTLEEIQAALERTRRKVHLERDNVWGAFKESCQAVVTHFREPFGMLSGTERSQVVNAVSGLGHARAGAARGRPHG